MIKIINMIKCIEFEKLKVGDLFMFDFLADDCYSLPPVWMKTDHVENSSTTMVVSMDGAVDYTAPKTKVYPVRGELKVSFYNSDDHNKVW